MWNPLSQSRTIFCVHSRTRVCACEPVCVVCRGMVDTLFLYTTTYWHACIIKRWCTEYWRISGWWSLALVYPYVPRGNVNEPLVRPYRKRILSIWCLLNVTLPDQEDKLPSQDRNITHHQVRSHSWRESLCTTRCMKRVHPFVRMARLWWDKFILSSTENGLLNLPVAVNWCASA